MLGLDGLPVDTRTRLDTLLPPIKVRPKHPSNTGVHALDTSPNVGNLRDRLTGSDSVSGVSRYGRYANTVLPSITPSCHGNTPSDSDRSNQPGRRSNGTDDHDNGLVGQSNTGHSKQGHPSDNSGNHDNSLAFHSNLSSHSGHLSSRSSKRFFLPRKASQVLVGYEGEGCGARDEGRDRAMDGGGAIVADRVREGKGTWVGTGLPWKQYNPRVGHVSV